MKVGEGLHLIEVPTLLPVGTVNLYLLEGEPLTLVDTGPKDQEAHSRINRALRDADYSISDLDQIIITHGHVDHHGLAERLKKESGARVLVHEADREIVQSFSSAFRRRAKSLRSHFLRVGAPEGTVDMLSDFVDYLGQMAEDCPVDGVLRDGELVSAGGKKIKVFHTPGHSPGSCCLLDPTGNLLSGDTLLKDLTPTSVFGSSDGKSMGIADFLHSLHRLKQAPVKRIYPGHREAFADVAEYAARCSARCRERQEQILFALSRGPATPFQLMQELFGSLPIGEAFVALAEVIGHAEILEDEGSLRVEEKDDVTFLSLRK